MCTSGGKSGRNLRRLGRRQPWGTAGMSVFVVLGLIWAAVLVPPLVRARAERREKFIDSFRDQMGALDNRRARATEIDRKVGSHAKVRIRRKASPAQRRRDILGGMLGALMGSLVLGLF